MPSWHFIEHGIQESCTRNSMGPWRTFTCVFPGLFWVLETLLRALSSQYQCGWKYTTNKLRIQIITVRLVYWLVFNKRMIFETDLEIVSHGINRTTHAAKGVRDDQDQWLHHHAKWYGSMTYSTSSQLITQNPSGDVCLLGFLAAMKRLISLWRDSKSKSNFNCLFSKMLYMRDLHFWVVDRC